MDDHSFGSGWIRFSGSGNPVSSLSGPEHEFLNLDRADFSDIYELPQFLFALEND